jgi:hypothetical protein
VDTRTTCLNAVAGDEVEATSRSSAKLHNDLISVGFLAGCQAFINLLSCFAPLFTYTPWADPLITSVFEDKDCHSLIRLYHVTVPALKFTFDGKFNALAALNNTTGLFIGDTLALT